MHDWTDPESPRHKHAQHGKSIVIKGEEKKMDISTKRVKLVKYGKGLRFTAQFLPPLKKVGILGGVR